METYCHLSPRDIKNGKEKYEISVDEEGNLRYRLLNKKLFSKEIEKNIQSLIDYFNYENTKTIAENNFIFTLSSFQEIISPKLVEKLVDKNNFTKMEKIFENLINLLEKEERIEILIAILKLIGNFLTYIPIRKNYFENNQNSKFPVEERLYKELMRRLDDLIKMRTLISASLFSFNEYFLLEEILIVFYWILKVNFIAQKYFNEVIDQINRIIDFPIAKKCFDDRIIILAISCLRPISFGDPFHHVKNSFISNQNLNQNLILHLSTTNNQSIVEVIINVLINFSSGSDQHTDHVIKIPRLLRLFEFYLNVTTNQNTNMKSVDIQIAIYFCLSNFACGSIDQREIVFYNEISHLKNGNFSLYVNHDQQNLLDEKREKEKKKFHFLSIIGKNFSNYEKNILIEVLFTLLNLISYSEKDYLQMLIKFDQLNIFYCLFYGLKWIDDQLINNKNLLKEINIGIDRLIKVGDYPIREDHFNQINDDQNITKYLSVYFPPNSSSLLN